MEDVLKKIAILLMIVVLTSSVSIVVNEWAKTPKPVATREIVTIQDVTELMYDEEIVMIQTKDYYVMYRGNVRSVNKEYLDLEVEKIGACNDTEEPITTIILKKTIDK